MWEKLRELALSSIVILGGADPELGTDLSSAVEGRLHFQRDRRRESAFGLVKAQKRMRDAIYANTGALPKPWNPHDIRRTVATPIAETLGEAGDKLVKRVLGHADRQVTAIYNRYAYVNEMRHVLTQWANELLATEKMVYVCGAPDNIVCVEGPRPTSLAA